MYSGISDQRRWVLPAVLEEQAELHGDKILVSMTSGDMLTYRQLRDQAAQVAGMLSDAGNGPHDRIALMLPNGLDFLRAWSGVGRLGATAVLLNTELTGDFLAHPLADAAPRTLIIHSEYLSRLSDIKESLASVELIFVVSGHGEGLRDFAAWQAASQLDAELPLWTDTACIMYTSGTSGPPKGVLMPHAHCYLFGHGVVENCQITAEDHYYICLPLSHANGLLMQMGAVLIAGAQATVRDRFSATAWLSDVRSSGATVTNTLGAISPFVIGQPETSQDRDHNLRLILSAPNHSDHEQAWRERFGIKEVLGGYGMTEVNIPLHGRIGDPRPGTCGRVYEPYFEVEIRDPQTDQPLAPGEVGEIMVRPGVAQGFMAGYVNSPEKTVEAWRNLWFHTGDAGRLDEDGYVTFVDRIKDCIRRRGENISATDIERVLLELPGIAEVAAFAVPSEITGAEDEIMCAIVPLAGAAIKPQDIVNHARARMPRFAQPRYIEYVSSLPKTATEKVQKSQLRSAGVTTRALDLQKWASA